MGTLPSLPVLVLRRLSHLSFALKVRARITRNVSVDAKSARPNMRLWNRRIGHCLLYPRTTVMQGKYRKNISPVTKRLQIKDME
jgi:hypothetical protein